MLLVKSCDSKFNPKICGTIKIGTLYEYRNTEIQEIADNAEGFFDFRIRISGAVKVPVRWFNFITSRLISLGEHSSDPLPIFPGVVSVSVGNLHSSSSIGKYATLIDTIIDVHREDINGFIFCMSLLRKSRDAEGIFNNYDDKWYCTFGKVDLIADHLAKSVRQKAIEEFESGNPLFSHIESDKEVHVFVRHAPVRYTSRESVITSESEYDVGDLMAAFQDMSFIKPVYPFSVECEYRFHIVIGAGDMIVEPWKDSLIIDVSGILDIVL